MFQVFELRHRASHKLLDWDLPRQLLRVHFQKVMIRSAPGYMKYLDIHQVRRLYIWSSRLLRFQGLVLQVLPHMTSDH